MLISMPTQTSAIFGVFQDITFSNLGKGGAKPPWGSAESITCRNGVAIYGLYKLWLSHSWESPALGYSIALNCAKVSSQAATGRLERAKFEHAANLGLSMPCHRLASSPGRDWPAKCPSRRLPR